MASVSRPSTTDRAASSCPARSRSSPSSSRASECRRVTVVRDRVMRGRWNQPVGCTDAIRHRVRLARRLQLAAGRSPRRCYGRRMRPQLRGMTMTIAILAGVILGAATIGGAAAFTDRRPSGTAAWTPSPSDTWQYQLQGTIDRTVAADVFDVDAFDVSKETVAALHARGRHVLCYVDAGSWEPYRPDRDAYPNSVIGKAVDGWPGERWLDIRR